MPRYIALIRKGRGTDFGVDFPDFPGCVTVGPTLDAALAHAGEALAFHVEGMAEDGEALPAPSELDAVMAKHANRDAVAALVDLPGPSRLARVNITMDEALLRRADAMAERRGMTRSGLIAEALRRIIEPPLAGVSRRHPPRRRSAA